MDEATHARDRRIDEAAPDPRFGRRRREAVVWASAEELEVLGGIGEDRTADWTVLTLEGARDVPDADPTRESFVAADRRAASDGVRRMAGAADRRTASAAPAVTGEVAPFESADDIAAPGPATPAVSARRTIVIRGQVADRGRATVSSSSQRRRPARRPSERVGHRPDRVALWAVVLGLLLILVAAVSAGAAPL